VTSLRKNIVAGDIIQAVPSHRLTRKIGFHPWTIYKELRAINPSRYGFFVECPGFEILGSSPELLVKVKEGVVTNHPIAGTRKRGKTKEEDEALARELLDDEKGMYSNEGREEGGERREGRREEGYERRSRTLSPVRRTDLEEGRGR
jgi:anthranilate/para-aminobenzoate synthase component I